MVALAFDTLDAARTLRNAGVDERTAEAIVHVVQRTAELPDISHLATKDDFAALRADIARLDPASTGRRPRPTSRGWSLGLRER